MTRRTIFLQFEQSIENFSCTLNDEKAQTILRYIATRKNVRNCAPFGQKSTLKSAVLPENMLETRSVNSEFLVQFLVHLLMYLPTLDLFFFAVSILRVVGSGDFLAGAYGCALNPLNPFPL